MKINALPYKVPIWLACSLACGCAHVKRLGWVVQELRWVARSHDGHVMVSFLVLFLVVALLLLFLAGLFCAVLLIFLILCSERLLYSCSMLFHLLVVVRMAFFHVFVVFLTVGWYFLVLIKIRYC